MQKDHYENISYVCPGQKEFIFLHEDDLLSGSFSPIHDDKVDGESHNDSNYSSWNIVADEVSDNREDGPEVKTTWIEPDTKKRLKKFKHCHKFPTAIKSTSCKGSFSGR